MSDEIPPKKGAQADWEARRTALDARLREHEDERRADENAQSTRDGSMRGMAQGLKIASEFISGIAVGGFIGYGIDYFAGTSPFGLIVFLLLGFGAGVLNVVRGSAATTEEMSAKNRKTNPD